MSERTRYEKLLLPFEGQKEYMNARIKDGIEANRKAFATFIAVDKDGKPVTNAKIRLKQKNHEFQHGANIFMLDELETPEKNAEYKKRFAEVFNLATLPFYWDAFEPEDGKPRFAADSEKVYRRPASDLCINYCREHGIEPKLHCLNYDLFRPAWLTEKYLTNAEIKKRLSRRMAEIAEHYADIIPGIEVINETLCWGSQIPLENRRDNRYHGLLAEPEIVEWSFKEAEKYFPHNELIINEATFAWLHDFKYDRTPYYMQIERALLKGARIDTIGFQNHFWWNKGDDEEANEAKTYYDPYRIYEALDTFAKLGKPLQITETTFPTPYKDGDDLAEAEAVQAEIVKNMYSIWFSHPAVKGAIYWNLVDGYAWGATQGDMTKGENFLRGGLLRFDLTPKPSFEIIKKLFNEEWHTDEIAETNEFGTAFIKAFYGDYDLEIVNDGKTEIRPFKFTKGNTEKTFKLVL